MPSRFWRTFLFIAAGLFALELWFLPRPGIQADEVLFAAPFLKGITARYTWHLGSFQIPVMVMDYIGALKTWLYWPLFQSADLNVWSIRLPAAILAIATLVVFADLVRRVAGSQTALFASLLLATDASFIFTNIFDWGPVALLLFGVVAFLNLMSRFAENGRAHLLAAACFLAGISLWDKAVFVFPLFGIACAALLVFGKNLSKLVSPRALGAAVIGLLIGAAPLISFNLVSAGSTITASESFDPAPVSERLLMMQRTLDGRALEHYMFRSLQHEAIPLAGKPLADLVAEWYQHSELAPGSLLFAALAVSLLLLPLLQPSTLFRPLLFAWIASLATFLLMLTFPNAGAGPHHTIFVYPGPHFIVAATIAACSECVPDRTRLITVVGMVIVLSNVVLLWRYSELAQRNGFSVYWSNGSTELARTIESQSLPVAFLDWGIENPVRIEANDSIQVAGDSSPRAGIFYATHCAPYVIDEAAQKSFEQKLTDSGLQRAQVRSVADPLGNAVFCVFTLSRK